MGPPPPPQTPKPKPKKQQQQPLHESPVFLVLSGLMGLFMMMSLVLHARLQDMEESDDLIIGSGGGDGLRDPLLVEEEHPQWQTAPHRHHYRSLRKHEQQQEEEEEEDSNSKDQNDDDKEENSKDGGDDENNKDDGDDDDDPPNDQLLAFQREKKNKQRKRQKDGIVTPRESFEHDNGFEDSARIRAAVDKLRQSVPAGVAIGGAIGGGGGGLAATYDIYDCPKEPPDGYPFAWNAMDVLEHWNPDDTTIPNSIHQGLCVFDWNNQTDKKTADHYRKTEVPFVLQNLPEALRASERWMTPGYLEQLIGDEKVNNEHSPNNHFMYWKTAKHPKADFVPPTDMIDLTYQEWLEKAQTVQEARKQTKEEHWYFRLNAMFRKHSYLYEELPFFDPTLGKSLTMVQPNEHRGINCRFGMKGVTAEAHYDSHNNFIVLMGGQRRYILAHPDQCENMELYPVGHPSARHSRINWSDAVDKWRDTERPFTQAKVNEVVLQAGDMLYLPTFWFHFIVSLNINYQCNSRSGDSLKYEESISRCGFGPRREYDNKK